jgi:hypothetical protein
VRLPTSRSDGGVGLGWGEGVSRGAGVVGGVAVIRSGTAARGAAGCSTASGGSAGRASEFFFVGFPVAVWVESAPSESNASWASSRSAKPCPLGMR